MRNAGWVQRYNPDVGRRKTVSFQGEKGAFSQVAVQQLLGPDVEVRPCQRFEEVFRALADGKVDAAVVPIENTLHGSVHENYDHLVNFELPIHRRNERAYLPYADRLSGRSVSKHTARLLASGRPEPVRQFLSRQSADSNEFRFTTRPAA